MSTFNFRKVILSALIFILYFSSSLYGQNAEANLKNSFGFVFRTGPCISISDKNLTDTFNLFRPRREDGLGLIYGYKNFYLSISRTKKTFDGGPIKEPASIVGRSYSGGEKIADQQVITFEGKSFDIKYTIDIAYLNAGIDYYKIKEKFEGLTEEYFEQYGGNKFNKKIGGHLGFGISYNYSVEHFFTEPFMGLNYFYIDGKCEGLRQDFYLRSGFRIDFGLIIGFKI